MHFTALSHDLCHVHCSPPSSLNPMVISSTLFLTGVYFILSKVFSPTGLQLTGCCAMYCTVVHVKPEESSHIWDTWTDKFGCNLSSVRPRDLYGGLCPLQSFVSQKKGNCPNLSEYCTYSFRHNSSVWKYWAGCINWDLPNKVYVWLLLLFTNYCLWKWSVFRAVM